MMNIVEECYESVFPVKFCGGIVYRVHFNCMDAEYGGQIERALEGIQKQPFPKPHSLSGLIDGQPREKYDGNWVLREFSGYIDR